MVSQKTLLFGFGRVAAYHSGARVRISYPPLECNEVFNKDGSLQQEAIASAVKIQDVAKYRSTSIVRQILAERGNINDWGKYRTRSFYACYFVETKLLANVHFYRNSATGEVCYDLDFKIKFHGNNGSLPVIDFVNQDLKHNLPRPRKSL